MKEGRPNLSTSLIVTLIVNGLNTPIKRNCQIGLKRQKEKKLSKYIMSTRNSFQAYFRWVKRRKLDKTYTNQALIKRKL